MEDVFGCELDVEEADGFEVCDEPRYYFPGGSRLGGSNGLIVRFFRDRKERRWTGVFAYGRVGRSGIYPHPNCKDLVVISRGIAYVADPLAPQDTREIDIYPVYGVTAFSEERLLFLHDSSMLACLGAGGPKWRVRFESTDELQFAGRSGGILLVNVWMPNRQRFGTASIDTETGKCLNADLFLGVETRVP